MVIINLSANSIFLLVNNNRFRKFEDEQRFWPFTGFKRCSEHSWGHVESSCEFDLLLGYNLEEFIAYGIIVPLIVVGLKWTFSKQ